MPRTASGCAWPARCRAPIWTVAYDVMKGVWLDEGGNSLRGKIDLGVNEARDDSPA
jgi:hypothetical protein